MSEEIAMEVKDDPIIDIEHYRCLTRKYLEMHRYKTAQFWAEKVVTLSNEKEEDVYLLAQALFLSREFHRAAHIIKSKNLHKSNYQCCYLAASSLAAAKEYNEAIQTLPETLALVEDQTIFGNCHDVSSVAESITPLLGNILKACLHLERGKVYEAMENRELAAECFKEALQSDLHCYEAFDALIQHQMLCASEEDVLMASLPFTKHCATSADQELVKYLYGSRLNKYHSINLVQSSSPPWVVKRLEASLDQKVVDAERHYYNCHYSQCWKITQEVIAKDPYHTGCLPVHISCLVELKNSNDLFLLAHRLVDIYPESGVSWFAVGCYYYIIGKSDPARRYLGKATVLDKLFGPAWLAYGHSFASENEHDQAMAAYFKASQLMMGCHLPHLYIGLENGLTNNSALAEKFFQHAHKIAPNDPFVLHEMGVIAFQSEQHEKACKYFEEALSKVKVNDKYILPNKWEPLLNNLGHVYRKLQMYDKAIDCHMQAMMLMPNSYSTYSAIGFCQVLTGQTQKAVESFHKALSLKRDDTFSTTMLSYVLDLHIQETKDAGDPDIDVSNILKSPDKEMEVHHSPLRLLEPNYTPLEEDTIIVDMTIEESLIDVSNIQFRSK